MEETTGIIIGIIELFYLLFRSSEFSQALYIEGTLNDVMLETAKPPPSYLLFF